MQWNEIVATVLLSLGTFLTITCGVGILRMPDFFSRLHPAGKSDTLGQFLIFIGLLFLVSWGDSSGWLTGAKIIVITLLIFITAPTATHAITKAAWLDGLRSSGDADGNADGAISGLRKSHSHDGSSVRDDGSGKGSSQDDASKGGQT